MGVNQSKAGTDKGSRMISTVVSPAVQLWLRSQVEAVETLQFKLMGRDQQILRGHIPTVSIAACRAIYQGLHLSQIQLDGTNIRFNLTQVFKGKPLRLLEPVPVTGQLILQESDLQASLGAPLLSNALTELLNTFINSYSQPDRSPPLNPSTISWQQIKIDGQHLTLKGIVIHQETQETPIQIDAGIQRVTQQHLQLHPLQIQLNPQQPAIALEPFTIDLGSEVDLQELTLTPGQLLCRGCLKVIP